MFIVQKGKNKIEKWSQAMSPEVRSLGSDLSSARNDPWVRRHSLLWLRSPHMWTGINYNVTHTALFEWGDDWIRSQIFSVQHSRHLKILASNITKPWSNSTGAEMRAETETWLELRDHNHYLTFLCINFFSCKRRIIPLTAPQSYKD